MFGTSSMAWVQLQGILNAIKTGNPQIDAAASVVLPLLLSSALGKFWNENGGDTFSSTLDNMFLIRWLRGDAYTHTITYRCYQHQNLTATNLDNESRNQYLVRAVKLFVHQCCRLDLMDADVDLSDIAKQRYDGYIYYTTRSLLKACEIVKKPIQNKWNSVGVFDGGTVRMSVQDTVATGTEQSEKQKIRKVVIRLASSKKRSLDVFMKEALAFYDGQLAKLETKDRYFYDIAAFVKDATSITSSPLYNTYKLTGEKTFATIFSEPAKQLVKAVDAFRKKEGKYGIPGVPYKLGILLHGPPGTGKTSLIKALANHTNRHIINVSLSKIKTNQEFKQVFFSKRFKQNNLSLICPSTLDYSDVVFVMEDVDATSKVVTRRKDSKEKACGDDGDDGDDSEEENKKKEKGGKHPKTRDSLSLDGILNVFDGIVATPGRIIVMTTNHPELLDPALIRPGRIDKIIEMGFLSPNDAADMLEHYFGTTLEGHERTRLAQLFETKASTITPAALERHILESNSTEEVFRVLGKEKRRRVDDGPAPVSSVENGNK